MPSNQNHEPADTKLSPVISIFIPSKNPIKAVSGALWQATDFLCTNKRSHLFRFLVSEKKAKTKKKKISKKTKKKAITATYNHAPANDRTGIKIAGHTEEGRSWLEQIKKPGALPVSDNLVVN